VCPCRGGSPTCRLLVYTPGHPFIREALAAVAAKVLDHFEQRRRGEVVDLTGPYNFHPHGVAPVLARNGCTVDNETAVAEGLQLVRQGSPCAQTRRPEPIGIVQVRQRNAEGTPADENAGVHSLP
jgi:hypothetical protein